MIMAAHHPGSILRKSRTAVAAMTADALHYRSHVPPSRKYPQQRWGLAMSDNLRSLRERASAGTTTEQFAMPLRETRLTDVALPLWP